MIDRDHALPITRQASLLGMSRGSVYYLPRATSEADLELMRRIEALAPQPGTSKRAPGHKVYPYLLRGLAITRSNHVWATDITYIPMARGFLYLVAILDWASRYVLAWRLSNTLDTAFCLDALDLALSRGRPEIFNSDQGAQFTSKGFTDKLLGAGVQISMDGKGRCLDNVFVERLWRSLKYEEVYLKASQRSARPRPGSLRT